MDYANLRAGDVKAMLDGMTSSNAASHARIEALARRHAEARAATDAAISNAGKGSLLPAGMRPQTAILGTVAVAALAWGGMKLWRAHREPAQQRWTERIEQTRAIAARQAAEHGRVGP